MAPAGQQRPFAFGDWQVDPSRGLLTDAGGESVRLEPRLMDLLLLFAGSDGRVLGKDEITAATWGDRAIGDDTLAAAVSRLRRALGGIRERRYIETVPKRGYRTVVECPPHGSDPRAASDGPPEAAALVAQGRQALASPLPTSLTQARLCFEAAMAKAPGWSPAHQGLAEALIVRHYMEQGGDLAAAKAAARAAVGLDNTSAPAWVTLGKALLLAERDFAAADTAFQRAITLDPTFVTAHRRRAEALTAVGRFAEAERSARRAVALQPSLLEARSELLEILLIARRYRHAAAEAVATLSLAPDLGQAWYVRGWALAMSGDEAEGLDCLLKGLELWGVAAERLSALRAVFEAKGFAAGCGAAADLFAEQPLHFMRRGFPIASLRALAGQTDEAFAILDAAAARGDPTLMFFPWMPFFDTLKADVRYEPLASRVRLDG
ncbi:MAG TPA: winged helix-turn-helix domain-containing protein [Caulobacteraceae bacterium]|jgi:DNA-binding winged helix-turn-helix (wHTH) protein|nr:winged helix-turn-helix domain-containing protein [Caulobacteraceae bacterium]